MMDQELCSGQTKKRMQQRLSSAFILPVLFSLRHVTGGFRVEKAIGADIVFVLQGVAGHPSRNALCASSKRATLNENSTSPAWN